MYVHVIVLNSTVQNSSDNPLLSVSGVIIKVNTSFLWTRRLIFKKSELT